MGSSSNPTPAAMPAAAHAAAAVAAQANQVHEQEMSGTTATTSVEEAERETASPHEDAATAVAMSAAQGAVGSTLVASSSVSSREASTGTEELPCGLPESSNAAATAIDSEAAGSLSALQVVQRAVAAGVLGHHGSPSCFEAQYCINLPLENKAQLSRAIIADTLAAMPVPPQTVSNVQGPVLEVHQVGDHSVDVRIVHSFTANFDESLEQVYQQAVAAKQAAARQQRQATLQGNPPQHYAAAAAAAAGRGQRGRTREIGDQQHVQLRMASHANDHADAHLNHQHHMHTGRHRRQLSRGEEDQGCTCTELQDEDEQLLPQGIKWSNRCMVHEQELTSTDIDDAASHSAATNSIDDAGASSVSNSQPSSRDSMLAGPSAAAAAASRAAPRHARGAAATALGPSAFQGSDPELYNVFGHRAAQQAQQQQQLGVADTAVAAHGGRRLSVEVLRAVAGSGAAQGASGQFSAGAVVAPSAIDTVDETSSEGSYAPGVSGGARHQQQRHKHQSGHVQGQQGQQHHQQEWSGPSSSSSERSNPSTCSVTPAGSRSEADEVAAVLPGPAVTPRLRHHTPVLVTAQERRKTAHGHQEVDVAPLHALNAQHRQQEEQQQHQEQQQAQQTAVLQHGGTDATNPMDVHILHQPEGFVPLSGTTAGPAAAAAAAAAGGQQQGSEEPNLRNWPSNALGGTMIIPRAPRQQRQHQLGIPQAAAVGALPGVGLPRAGPRVFVPRCEWELDPRQVLVGRRLAVGGFAEVFLGKYEGTVVAIKRLLTNDAVTIERFVSEVRMLARLRHPNLILFMGYCTLPELCIVSEYMSKGSLYGVLHSPEQRKQRAAAARKELGRVQQDAAAAAADAQQSSAGIGGSSSALEALGIVPIGSLSAELQLSPAEEQQRQLEGLDPKLQRLIAVAVARGMAYLHTRMPPILHLDLKSPNIVVDDRWRVKITDFGLSRARQRTFVSSSAQGGTPEWMAPEVLRCESVAEPADVYSYGVVLWELITGRAPWENYNPMQVVAMVGFRDLALPVPRTAAEPFLLELCKRCMQRDPAARPTFPQIAALLDQQYGPPSWAVHAQPLLPPTPRPALLAAAVPITAGNAPAALPAPATPAAAAEVAAAVRDEQAQQQQQQQEEEEAVEQKRYLQMRPVQQVDRQAEQQEVQQPAATSTAAGATGGAGAVASPFACNMAPWSVESAQSLHAAAGEAASAGAAGAAVPVQSPFADNLAPWPVNSVQHMAAPAAADAGETSAAAAAPLAAGPVPSPFAGNLAPWSVESVQGLQASVSAAAAAASPFAGNTAPWSVESVQGLQLPAAASTIAAAAEGALVAGPAASPFAGNLAPWSVESVQGLQDTVDRSTAAAPEAAAAAGGAVSGALPSAGKSAQCSVKSVPSSQQAAAGQAVCRNPAAPGQGPVPSPFAGNTAPWSVESVQSLRHSADEAAAPVNTTAAAPGPAPSPFAGTKVPWSVESVQSLQHSASEAAASAAATLGQGPVPSPFAGNMAPWSVESVQSLHGAMGHSATAAADLQSSSTGSSSAEAAPAPVSGCSSTAFAAAAAEQQGVVQNGSAAPEPCEGALSQPCAGSNGDAAVAPDPAASNQGAGRAMYPFVDDTASGSPVASSIAQPVSEAATAAAAAATAAFGSQCAPQAPAADAGCKDATAEPAAAAAAAAPSTPASAVAAQASAATADEAAAAAVPCADSPTAPFHFKPGQECQATPLKVGTVPPVTLDVGSSSMMPQQQQQQRQASSILAAASGPTCSPHLLMHTPTVSRSSSSSSSCSSALSGPLPSSNRGEALSMPLCDDAARLGCVGPSMADTTSAGVAAAAVPDAWMNMLDPQMQAYIRAAGAAAAAREHGDSSNSSSALAVGGRGEYLQDGPASAPAGLLQQDAAAAAAWHAAVERGQADVAAGSTAGLSSHMPSEGSVLHSLWPSMTTDGSFASLPSRQASQGARHVHHVPRRGVRSSDGGNSSSGDEGKVGGHVDNGEGNVPASAAGGNGNTTSAGTDLGLQQHQQHVQQQQPDWCSQPVHLSCTGMGPTTPPSAAATTAAPGLAAGIAACNDCSRSSSPDTTRQQQQQQHDIRHEQQQQQQQQQLPVYQVWPVLLARSAGSTVDPADLPLLLKKASPPEKDASKKDKKALSGCFQLKGITAAADAAAEGAGTGYHEAATEQQQSPRSAVVAAGVKQLLLRPGSPAAAAAGRPGSPACGHSTLAAAAADAAGSDIDAGMDADRPRSGGSTRRSSGRSAGGELGFGPGAAKPGSCEVLGSDSPAPAIAFSHLLPKEARRDQALLTSPRPQQQQEQDKLQQQVVHELPLQHAAQQPSAQLQHLSQQQQEIYQHIQQQQQHQLQQHLQESPARLVAAPKRHLHSHLSGRSHSFDASVLKQAVQHVQRASQQQQVSSYQKKGRFTVSTTTTIATGSMDASKCGAAAAAAAAAAGGATYAQDVARHSSQLSPRGRSTTTCAAAIAAAALHPAPVPGKPLKHTARALHGSMGDLAAEAAQHIGTGKDLSLQQQMPAVTASSAPQSLLAAFLQQQQQQQQQGMLHQVSRHAVSGAVSLDSAILAAAAAAASAAATSCADSSLGLMSAVEQPPGQLLPSGLSCNLSLPNAASSAALMSEPLHVAGPAAAITATEQMRGQPQQEQSLHLPVELPMMLTAPTSTEQIPELQQGLGGGASPARCLGSRGFWGSGVTRDGSPNRSAEAVGDGNSQLQQLQSHVAEQVGKQQQQGAGSPKQHQQQGAVSPKQKQQQQQSPISAQQQARRPRGASSPGTFINIAANTHITERIGELGTSSNVDGGSSSSKTGLPSHPSVSQLLQMHFSTGGLSSGGLCYKSGRFSVTVEQQQLQGQGSGKGLKASSSAGMLGAASAGHPSGSSGYGQDQQQQQHGLVHASASCSSLPVLVQQQRQQTAVASPSRIVSVEMHSSDHAGDAASQLLAAAVPAAGTGSAAISGSECSSYWSSAEPSLMPSLAPSNRPSDEAIDASSSSMDAAGRAAAAAVGATPSAVQPSAASLANVSDGQGHALGAPPVVPAAVQQTDLQQVWGSVDLTPTSQKLAPAAAATAATAAAEGALVAGLDAAAAAIAPLNLPQQSDTPPLLSLSQGLGPGGLGLHRFYPESQAAVLHPTHPQVAAATHPGEASTVAAVYLGSPGERLPDALTGQRGSPLPQQQQQQQLPMQGSSPPLHQRRLLAHPPAHIAVPATSAAAGVAVVQSAVPLPLQQQQQHAGAVLSEGRSSETGRISTSSLGTVPPVSRTTSIASSTSGLSPRSAAACGKPPLVPQHCRTPSPNATPLPSPRPRAVSRDYCRGRFQVHESPLVGPLQAWKGGVGSTGGTDAPHPTPVATPTAATAPASAAAVHGAQGAAGSVSVRAAASQKLTESSPIGAAAVFAAHLQQEQQQQSAINAVMPGSPQHQVSWAGVVAGCTSPPPHAAGAAMPSAPWRGPAANSSSTSVSPLVPGKAPQAGPAAAAAPDTTVAATTPTSAASAQAAVARGATAAAAVGSHMAKSLSSVKLGRFLVTHESGGTGSTGGTRASRAGSAASSTHASRAGSPRWEHPPLPSKLGSSKNLAAAVAAANDRSGVGVLPQPTARRMADTNQQQLPQANRDAAAAAAPAVAAASASTAAAVHAQAQGAAAAGAAGLMQPAVSAALSDLSSISSSTVGTAAAAAISAPHLAPIKTVSKRGRFVVTQVTPAASTTCSTPKSGFLGPAGVSAHATFTAGPAATPTASPAEQHCAIAAAELHTADGTDRAALNAAAAAAAAAWLEAAAASSAAAAVGSTVAAGSTAAEALVLTCPVCDTPHALPGQQVQPGSTEAAAATSPARQLFPDAMQQPGDGKQESTAPLPAVTEGSSSTDAASAAATVVPAGATKAAASAVLTGHSLVMSPLPPTSPVVGGNRCTPSTVAFSPPRPVVCYSSTHIHSGSSGSPPSGQAAGAGGVSPGTTLLRSVSPLLHTCSSCGAPLPPLPVVVTNADLAATQAIRVVPAAAAARGGTAAAAAAGPAAVPTLMPAPAVVLGTATGSGTMLAAVQDAVQAVQAGGTLGAAALPVLQPLVPQGLLAAAAARVLAARQHIQQEGSVAGSDISSQVSYASCCQPQLAQHHALGQQHQHQLYSRNSSFTAAGGECAGVHSGRSSIGCLQADGVPGAAASASTAAAAAVLDLTSVPAAVAAAGDVVAAAEQAMHRAPNSALLAALQLPVSHPLQCLASPGSDTAISDRCSCSSPPCNVANSSNGSRSTGGAPALPHGALMQPQQLLLPEGLPALAGLVAAAPTTLQLDKLAADAACPNHKLEH